MPGPRQPRVSWAALWDYAGRRGITEMGRLSERCGVNIRDLHRYRAAGELGERAADRIAVGLGDVPDAIWGAEYAAATAEMVAKAEAEEAAEEARVEAEAAERRARVAARQRSLRRRNRSYAERQNRRRREWGERNRVALAARNAAYEDANRERLNEAARQRRAADPEAYRAKQRAYRARRRGGLQVGHRHPGQDPTTTSTSLIHAQSDAESTANPHVSRTFHVTPPLDNGATEQQEVA